MKYPSNSPLLSALTPQDKRNDEDGDGDDEDEDDDEDDDDDDNDEQSLVSYDDFSVEGISHEELQCWSKLAPEGQKLEDVRSPPKKSRDDAGSFERMLLASINITTWSF